MNSPIPPVISSAKVASEHVASCALMRMWLLGTVTRIWIRPGFACCEGPNEKISDDIGLWLAVAGFAWESKGGPVSVCLQSEPHLQPAAEIIKRSPLLCYHTRFKPFRVFTPEELINHTSGLVWEVLESHQEAILELAAVVRKKKTVDRKAILSIIQRCDTSPNWETWRPEVIQFMVNALARLGY